MGSEPKMHLMTQENSYLHVNKGTQKRPAGGSYANNLYLHRSVCEQWRKKATGILANQREFKERLANAVYSRDKLQEVYQLCKIQVLANCCEACITSKIAQETWDLTAFSYASPPPPDPKNHPCV